MFKFIIDIFCKDTIIGLSQFENSREKRKKGEKLTSSLKKIKDYNLNIDSMFIGPCVYHL